MNNFEKVFLIGVATVLTCETLWYLSKGSYLLGVFALFFWVYAYSEKN